MSSIVLLARRLVGNATVLLLLVATVGCHNLFGVANPDEVLSSSFDTPEGALTRAAGANSAFAGAVQAAAVASGLLTDELTGTGFISGTTQIDQRALPAYQVLTPGYPYDGFSTTRIAALRAISTLHQYNPSQTALISQMFSVLGYTEEAFAENMCPGIPLAVLDANDNPTYGPIESRAGLLQTAAAHFDSALVYAHGDTTAVPLAEVGLARTLLAGGNWAAASQAAHAVSETFVYAIPATTNSPNGISTAFANQWIAVANNEGNVGLPFISANDSRVQVVASGTDANGNTIYVTVPGTSITSPLTLANGIEARLIVAEAALPVNGGTGSSWLDTLNSLRATIGDTALQDPGVDSARVNLLFRERAFWLFVTNHRQGDLRRLIQLYGRTVNSLFPNGLYQGGPNSYGTTTTFTPFLEQTNPNFKGCTSFSP
jgi:hypothetical protein